MVLEFHAFRPCGLSPKIMPRDLGAPLSLHSASVTIRRYHPSNQEGEKEGRWGSKGDAWVLGSTSHKVSTKVREGVQGM